MRRSHLHGVHQQETHEPKINANVFLGDDFTPRCHDFGPALIDSEVHHIAVLNIVPSTNLLGPEMHGINRDTRTIDTTVHANTSLSSGGLRP